MFYSCTLLLNQGCLKSGIFIRHFDNYQPQGFFLYYFCGRFAVKYRNTSL